MELAKVENVFQSEGKKILLYHTDLDGVCSATIFLKFFPGFETIPREGPLIGDRFLQELVDKKPDVLVVLDIPIDQEWQKIDRIKEKLPDLRIVLIDHHVPEKDLNSDLDIHINPRFEENVYIPTSCMIYNLLKEMGKEVKDVLWISVIGTIGDYGIKDCKKLFDEAREAYPGLVGDNPMKSKFRDISEYILASFILYGVKGVAKSLDILMATKQLGEVMENEYFLKSRKLVKKEINRILSDFQKRRKEYENLDLYIYRIESRLNMASTISSLIAEKYPDKIIIMKKVSGDHIKVSARCQTGEINLNEILKEAVSGIGSGGGHEKAAGAIIKRQDIDEFEKRVIEMIEKIKLQ